MGTNFSRLTLNNKLPIMLDTSHWAMTCVPTMWYVGPAKSQTSLRIGAIWPEPLLFTWIFYDSKATDRTLFGVSKLKMRLHRLVQRYTCLDTTLLEITCHGSIVFLEITMTFWQDLKLNKKQVSMTRYMESQITDQLMVPWGREHREIQKHKYTRKRDP